jgi:hypothetical protein
LEQGIAGAASIDVCVAAAGIDPWEDKEMQAALRLAVRDRRPVIPVLLPGAPHQPDLPLFLVNWTWVDLRAGLTSAAVDNLIWGITGQRPAAMPDDTGTGAARAHPPPGPAPVPSETLFIEEVLELLYRYPTLSV